ncbi:pentatricopeptide repeat-containing protein At1g08070, chloroplastic-like [Vigna radiata var. radiata]|uniref:Pentatricopeptide repeat-containing protein At1g08070, chloroplastic-like n=1 Tax=Vigna radiata var. radiata TaxID=3916 RepID=A0A1S3VAV2_VIGRR|nr:pentatricopeptide repeat-containing protein At1g08070, chloroplastic-like [Vigna radiata var. radiata]
MPSPPLARFTFISSKLLAFCALSPHADLRYAHTLFSCIPFPPLFHYNTIIAAFSRRSSSPFLRMLNDIVRPNACTFTLLLSKASPSLSFIQQLYSLILRLGHLVNPYVATSLVATYFNHACTRVVRRVFNKSPNKNVACCTSLLTGYCNNSLVYEARKVFEVIPDKKRRVVQRNGLWLHQKRPNNSLLASVLSACAAISAFEEGKWIHSYVHRNGELEYHEVELGFTLMYYKLHEPNQEP